MPAFPATARPAIASLEASAIRAVAESLPDLTGVIPLWFGEADVATPRFITEAAHRSLDAGETFYAANLGLRELREAIARYNARAGRTVPVERICVTSAGVNALMLACQALLDPGDRVLLPTPHWPNLSEIPRLLGAAVETVPLRLSNGLWQIGLDELLAAIRPDTRLVILNSPANPTGWTLTRDEQRAVLDHCRRLGVWILADEVYERLCFDDAGGSAPGRAPSFLDIASPEDRLVVVNSFSKSWAMTGWRLGWLVLPPTLMPAFNKVTEYNTSCAPTFVQRAGVAALDEGDDFVTATTGTLRARRDLAAGLLNRVPGLHAPVPRGAMYLFLAVDGERDSLSLAKRILREAKVGLAPGVAFGPAGEGCLRLCFAVAEERLAEACGRLDRFFRGG
ncbi:pyridoxal phosphate-dependent aminotransferase [Roseomonas sp. NAR14]|uniref:Aminotransferase n=1 Tax=Roseomonas acroporae TaxID=2937791 RepID=A0A9X2BXS7_9PROT|nr:pyridoxal phosphate-dependent aminotransferase [Roseomonas acroporae]MCK8786254.1 pyridoxal phosphate-dependent aminotransferase [Roseomonas acroporae]